MSNQVIMRCHVPDWYSDTTHAILDVNPEFIDDIVSKMIFGNKLREENDQFEGLIYRDYSPYFLDFDEYIDNELSGEEADKLVPSNFDQLMDSDESFILPSLFDIHDLHDRNIIAIDSIDVVQLKIKPRGKHSTFYWDGYIKHSDDPSRVETYSMGWDELYKWADSLGYSFCKCCGDHLQIGHQICTDCEVSE